jgi:hypothetical protein
MQAETGVGAPKKRMISDASSLRHVGRRTRDSPTGSSRPVRASSSATSFPRDVLQNAVLRSPHEVARIRSIDTSEVEAPEENPDPSDPGLRHGIAGNLCRCTGDQVIVDSILDAVARMRD